MGADRLAEAVALVAAVAGCALAVVMWSRSRRTRARAAGRHPATAPPISLAVVRRDHGAHLSARLGVAWPSTSVDIVTHRLQGTEAWTSEPIVDPIVLSPGETVRFDTPLADPNATYDAVVGWTTHHWSGDVTGSRAMTVPTPAPAEPATTGGPFRVVHGIAAAVLALIAAVALLTLASNRTASVSVDAIESPTESVVATSAVAPVATTVVATASTVAVTSTIPVPTGTPATTTPRSTSTTASRPSTVPASTASSPNSTAAPATTAPGTATTATTSASDPRIELSSRVEDCRFGADCLIVGFELIGFAGSGEYVCEFDDGSRFTFRYLGTGADDACSSAGAAPTITIEVDGVRSATVSRGDAAP